jgi:putative membrane protein
MEAGIVATYNPLVPILALVAAAGASGVAYLLKVARGKDSPELRREFGLLFLAVGVFTLGGFVQLLWTDWAGFPADHFTGLFGITSGLFAFLMIMAGLNFLLGLELRALAWPAVLIGLFLLQGGRAILDFDLTRNPFIASLLWFSAGLASLGLLLYAYVPAQRKLFAYLGAAVLALMSLVALWTGVNAFYGHIAEFVGRP